MGENQRQWGPLELQGSGVVSYVALNKKEFWGSPNSLDLVSRFPTLRSR